MHHNFSKLALVILMAVLSGCASSVTDRVVVSRPVILDLPFNKAGVPELPAGWGLRVERGFGRQAVLAGIGPPDSGVGGDVWIYWNHVAFVTPSRDEHLDSLVVVFSNERVSNLRIVNGETLRATPARTASAALLSTEIFTGTLKVYRRPAMELVIDLEH